MISKHLMYIRHTSLVWHSPIPTELTPSGISSFLSEQLDRLMCFGASKWAWGSILTGTRMMYDGLAFAADSGLGGYRCL